MTEQLLQALQHHPVRCLGIRWRCLAESLQFLQLPDVPSRMIT
jgi:hypothetical protein